VSEAKRVPAQNKHIVYFLFYDDFSFNCLLKNFTNESFLPIYFFPYRSFPSRFSLLSIIYTQIIV